MADYIYLLDYRLSRAQQNALKIVREIAREKATTLFLTGGAVRDLTAGSSVRDLDVTVQGSALKLKKDLEKAGAVVEGEDDALQSLYLLFPGGVRLEVGTAHTAAFPKPGKPVYTPASILDHLRNRDFTANAMAISLNEGSYGLLMDPMNGVADIENRELRLVSNYGFIEDPSRLLRATRLMTRLGWQMEERTAQRYKTAKDEDYIAAISPVQLGYELEEIVHEDDPLRILRALDTEGWMKTLFPAWGAAKVNTNALTDLQTKAGELQDQGVLAYPGTLQFAAVTAKMQPKDVTALKKQFPRQGFIKQTESLEDRTKKFQAEFLAKENSAPSAAWKLLHATEPEVVLSLYVSSKSAPVQNRFKAFLTEWPTAKQRIPYVMFGEMRITQDLPIYKELLDKLFFELMDNKLSTPEEMKAFLEPYSPPAPPPPLVLRRARVKKETKAGRGRAKKEAVAKPEPMSLPNEVKDVPVGATPSAAANKVVAKPAPASTAKAAKLPEKKAAVPAKSVAPPAKKAAPPVKTVVKKADKKAAPAKAVKKVAVKPAPKKVVKKAAPAKKAPAKKPVKKQAPAKKVVKKDAKGKRR